MANVRWRDAQALVQSPSMRAPEKAEAVSTVDQGLVWSCIVESPRQDESPAFTTPINPGSRGSQTTRLSRACLILGLTPRVRRLQWRNSMKRLAFISIAILCGTPAVAQLVEPNQLGVRMGHIHLAVTDVDAQKEFWISAMGGTLVKNGPLELIQFPGVFILLRKAEASPSAGSIVNHFGFIVKDMPGALARWKAANIEIEPTENPNEVYVHAPDGIRLEVYGEPALPTPVSMNHIHFYPVDVPAIKSWYVQAFGANPGRRPCVACLSNPRMIEADDLPGVNLSFSQATAAPLPTKGRALDHIGFEVDNLEAFVSDLDAKGIKIEAPIRSVPGANLKIAFLTDPWGTYIELTEGLAPE
jgi:catechol 2,3-dioxygenase-like lactoylglutathione lyase family enzyme